MRDPILSRDERSFLEGARRAVLATVAPDGRPRLVPICFVLDPARPVLYTPLDDKPKVVGDSMRLARVRDVLADPRVSILVDRWDEDWSRLGWLRCHGTAAILSAGDGRPDRDAAVSSLRTKYREYASHDLEARPMIRVAIEHVTTWGAIGLG